MFVFAHGNVVIFDIDETIRDSSKRLYLIDEIKKIKEKRMLVEKKSVEDTLLIEKSNSLWHDFFVLGSKDEPKKDVIELVNLYYKKGFTVKFLTGAPEKYRSETLDYLNHNNVLFHELKMRKDNVHIPDFILKPSSLAKYNNVNSVFATYDDREQVNIGYLKKGVKNVYLVDKYFDLKEHLIYLKEQFNVDLLS